MEVVILFSVVQTILAALNCAQLKELWSKGDSKSNRDELVKVVVSIKGVLLDAEAEYDQLSQETLNYINELNIALYDADDLLDEYVTHANRKRVFLHEENYGSWVSGFLDRFKSVTSRLSKGVHKITTKLERIATRHNNFRLGLDHTITPRKGREETCSYTNTTIIGRDEDVKRIIGMLLDANVSYLTIVGMGGLGKTALAQLVFHHETIKHTFPLRLWTCVSDHGQKNLNVKLILAKIIESASGEKYYESSLEVVVKQLREVLSWKRFLIILDDLWTESPVELQNLLGYLVGDIEGTQIVVTTRSKKTAKILGEGRTYELNGLSDDDSWHLFQQSAFNQTLETSNVDVDFINIGKDIVKICTNVPLAIRVMGRLLHKQGKNKWLKVKELGSFANLREGQNDIYSILKFSYHNLEHPLKSCFSYCSLYPKGFVINKETLIRLWIAQGYVVPLREGQSVEDASEEYFILLLLRCFFQDVQKDDTGEICSFKLHDLMHDVALEVSRKEICPSTSCTWKMDTRVRHVSLNNEHYANYGRVNTNIRTYLHVIAYRSIIDTSKLFGHVKNYKRLRTLDLSYLGLITLPNSIGKLIHLRYLDLSYNEMEVLPNSIRNLYNLQTLVMNGCDKLITLPRSFNKLVNLQTLDLNACVELTELPDVSNLVKLRVLGLYYCNGLISMPLDMSKLTKLYKLSMFVVGVAQSILSQHVELQGLKALEKLRGDITIVIPVPVRDAFSNDTTLFEETIIEGGYIRDKEHLCSITFRCKHENRRATDYEETLLGALQPHENLKKLTLVGYQGVRMPRWAIEGNLTSFLPNLVRLELSDLCRLKSLPSLRKLQHLKHLTLEDVLCLEYMETPPETCEPNGECLQFFPCLEELHLLRLPELKEWWGSSVEGPELNEWWESSAESMEGDNSITGDHQPHQSSLVFHGFRFPILEWLVKFWETMVGSHQTHRSLIFPQLINLDISGCPNLTSLPDCPDVKTLHLSSFNEKLRITSNAKSSLKLREVSIDSMAWLDFALPMKSFHFLTKLELLSDTNVKNLEDYTQVFQACSSSLRTLHIRKCSELKSVSAGLLYLTALERLTLSDLPIVTLSALPIGDPVESFRGSLSQTLRYLDIADCKKLQTFPYWMRKLSSLQELNVKCCSEQLYKRCQNPDGEDWHNIQHIPRIKVV